MAGDPAVRIRGLRKTYQRTPAVQDVDLDIEHGEIFALLGPNGAGKTTTIEILEGYRDRDGGTVSVLGADPAKAGLGWRRRIGVVLQENGDFPELTVGEVLNHFAYYYPDARDPDELLEAVGLTDKRDSRVHRLSGGQRRRLDVALGIIGNPRLLFLDEPTTGFDPAVRRQFWELISGLRAADTTILLTTHYLDEAEYLADRVAVIAAGTLVDVATPRQLGGRDREQATVAWTDAEGTHELRTDNPTRTVGELAARYHGDVPELSVRRPSLEDTYLRLIGGAR
ncbi:ABC transporter ATP-binding protein [Crossiella sp. CA198]|uniref:ABC transporter ATP-binding protein n=1 Tax=Crossiella sp. CA198 TaxID=3455607 RepID=UPI003F8D371A